MGLVMAKFKFYTSVCDYGVIEVVADNEEQAREKALAMDGTYHVHDTEVLDVDLAVTPSIMVRERLENLVHKRMTESELNERLTQIFGREVKVEQGQYEEDWHGDDYFAFCVDDEEIGGYFDIYYLKTNQDEFYITETCINFE